jgi:hypothetical protein
MTRTATAAERRHLERIKGMPCAVCAAPGPSDAHHIRQGQGLSQRAPHWLAVPLCKACHQGPDGIHGSKNLWKVHRVDEMAVLAGTIARLVA